MDAPQLSRRLVRESPGTVVLRIAGEVDYLAVPRVENYFAQMLQAEQPRHVLIDGSDLTFVVTPFLGSLIFWQEEVRKRQGRLIVFGLSSSLQRVMDVLRLERVLTFCHDEQAALVALNDG
jgi:stage II sporulation protein AA (anti-sigma F factor antagonist)